jgi:hypothetical protein
MDSRCSPWIGSGVPRNSLSARSIASATALVLAAPAAAQQQDEQLWLQVNTNVQVAPRLRLTLEQIGRFSDQQQGLYQTEFGGILGLRLSPNVELGLGYRKVGFHNLNPGAAEDRWRQHVVATFGPVTTRLRVDQRFHPDGDEIGFRIRPLVRYNWRLGAGRPTPFVSHESFFLPNSTSWGQRSGYERMRNIVGVALPFGRAVVADIGYLNQYRPARGSVRGQMDHALNLQLTINLQATGGPDIND